MGGDIIDYTLLQKKGILQRALALDSLNRKSNINENKVLDFTKSPAQQTSSPISSSLSSDSGIFAGFFGAVDSGVSGTSATNAPVQTFSQPIINNQISSLGVNNSAGNNNISSQNLEFNSLKVQLENAEFKLEQALKRIDELERKMIGIVK